MPWAHSVKLGVAMRAGCIMDVTRPHGRLTELRMPIKNAHVHIRDTVQGSTSVSVSIRIVHT
jgi:hypothetical protein